MAIDKLTSEDFAREVEGADGRIVVDFYADWCFPCHQVAPALEGLSAKWDGRVRFVKVNIDESPELSKTYGVFSIPTFMLFEDGKIVARTMGARSTGAIERDLGLADDHAPHGDKHEAQSSA